MRSYGCVDTYRVFEFRILLTIGMTDMLYLLRMMGR
jgi:hypothetical protein